MPPSAAPHRQSVSFSSFPKFSCIAANIEKNSGPHPFFRHELTSGHSVEIRLCDRTEHGNDLLAVAFGSAGTESRDRKQVGRRGGSAPGHVEQVAVRGDDKGLAAHFGRTPVAPHAERLEAFALPGREFRPRGEVPAGQRGAHRGFVGGLLVENDKQHPRTAAK